MMIFGGQMNDQIHFRQTDMSGSDKERDTFSSGCHRLTTQKLVTNVLELA